MSKNKLQPSRELLEKVITVAHAKTQLPLADRAYLNDWGVYCRVNHLPGGALFYQAGGKFVARLRFTVEKDGSIIVQKYQPGDWELALEPTYNHAKYQGEGGRANKELDELLAGTQSIEERILRLEKKVSESPNDALELLLGDFYSAATRYKDAERSYIRQVETWPNEFAPHYFLSLFYLHGLANAKLLDLPPSLLASRWAPLTLRALGYNYEQAHQLVEEHIGEAFKLAPPKTSFVKNFLKETLSQLRRIDKAPFPQKESLELAELAAACRLLVEYPGEARENLEQIVDRNPNFALAWSYLSAAYMAIGKLKDAERVAITAVKLAPESAICHFNLSTVYYIALCNSKGYDRDSIERFKRLLGPEEVQQLRRIDPSFFPEGEPPDWLQKVTLEELGCGYEHARQMVEKHARETIKLSADREFTKEAKSQLATLRMRDKITHNTDT